MTTIVGRTCYGCRKPRGVFAFLGGYWHRACFRRATPEQHRAAAQYAVLKPTP